VPNRCREQRVNNLIYGLKCVNIWIGPRQCRICNILEDEPNELVTEVHTDVLWEVLDPRVNPIFPDNSRE
jgi:hypothetical protein